MSTAKNIYVGRRYIPKPCGDWDNSKNTVYESLSVVLWQGASYTSVQDVPKGIDISNTNFWLKSADYNAQVEIYRQEVVNGITAINQNFENFKDEEDTIFNSFKDDVGVQIAEKTNPKYNQGGIVFGVEYLSAFHQKLMAWNTLSINTKFKIIFSGDSTTEGTIETPFHISDLMAFMAKTNGFPQIDCVNAGHSGKDTEHWNQIYVTEDLSNNPDLYVIRWGINDPVYSKIDNTPLPDVSVVNTTLDAQRRGVEEFETSLRSGLQKIRNQKDYTQLSIILMSPSSTSDTPNRRDEAWYESIIPVIKKASRDFQCCYIDTYQLVQDSRNASNYMDNPYGDGRHIHPNAVMNLWIASSLHDVTFPSGFKAKYGAGNILNESSANVMKSVNDSPSTYPIGISMFRTQLEPLDFPANGGVFTFKSIDGVVFQLNVGYHSPMGCYIRSGITTSDEWTDFTNLGIAESANLVLLNEWVLYDSSIGRPALVSKDNNGYIHLQGLIKGGIIIDGTWLLDLPISYRPNTALYLPIATSGGVAIISIGIDGSVVIVSGVTNNTWLSLDGISFLP